MRLIIQLTFLYTVGYISGNFDDKSRQRLCRHWRSDRWEGQRDHHRQDMKPLQVGTRIFQTFQHMFGTRKLHCSLEKRKRSCSCPSRCPSARFSISYFFTNKSCLFGLLRDWGNKFVILRTEADIRNFVFQCMLIVAKKFLYPS